MKKSEREIIFNKYGGRCAYCGCKLEKGWHVDHMEPVGRTSQREYIFKRPDGSIVSEEQFKNMDRQERYLIKRTYVDHKMIKNPDANHINNYMPSCASCNINKGECNVEEFRQQIHRYVTSLNTGYTVYKMAKRYNLVRETQEPVVFYFEKHEVTY